MDRQEIDQRIDVHFNYPVYFTRDVFAKGNPTLKATLGSETEGQRALVFIDEGVAQEHPDLGQRITSCFDEVAGVELVMEPRVVTGGEAIKNDYRLTMEIVDTILEGCLCRHSYVIAIGGGAVLDAVGFSTSIVHRGLRLIRLPTTVLAQNDAGIGVKNGMNLHGGKNTIGTFHPPHAVINDITFLSTLSDRDWRAGTSEAFKVAIIKDAPFYAWLCKNAASLNLRDEAVMQELIYRCAELHLDHIRSSGDPFELGSARPLDFGHWAAHKLECMSQYRVLHGEAVAVGMLLDALYAVRVGLLEASVFESLYVALSEVGLPCWAEALDRRLGDGTHEVLLGLEDFRTHLGGRLCVTLPTRIGVKTEVSEMDKTILAVCIDELKRRAHGESPVEHVRS